MAKNEKQKAFFEKMKQALSDDFEEEEVLADVEVLMETPTKKIKGFRQRVYDLEDSNRDAEADSIGASAEETKRFFKMRSIDWDSLEWDEITGLEDVARSFIENNADAKVQFAEEWWEGDEPFNPDLARTLSVDEIMKRFSIDSLLDAIKGIDDFQEYLIDHNKEVRVALVYNTLSEDDSVSDTIWRNAANEAGNELGISTVSDYLFDNADFFPDDDDDEGENKETTPTAPTVYDLLLEASNLEDEGKIDEAIEKCHQAVTIYPQDSSCQNMLGSCYYKKKDYDNAIRCLEKALELNPDVENYKENLGLNLYSQAKILYKEGKLDEAIEKIRRAIELSPSKSKYLNDIGWYYYEKGEYDTAIPYLDRAIEANFINEAAYDSRGECYYSKGNFVRAVADFKEALELDPDKQLYKDNLAKAEAALAEKKPADKAVPKKAAPKAKAATKPTVSKPKVTPTKKPVDKAAPKKAAPKAKPADVTKKVTAKKPVAKAVPKKVTPKTKPAVKKVVAKPTASKSKPTVAKKPTGRGKN